MTAIDEIKARLDIVDLVSETVELRRSGKNYVGFCPFHSNTRTPAFAVFPETGTWRCFGQCGEGGDIYSFLMKKEGWDFSETLRFLADKTGIQLKPPTPQEQAQAEEHEELRSLLGEAVTFYRHQLLKTEAGKKALNYLHQRGFSDKTIETFGLGYAPKSWDETSGHLKSKGSSDEDLLDCGLVSERDEGGVYDRFRHRVMIPIWDERGHIAGFGARVLNPQDVPKYLNSPQTPLFDKSNLLYGLDRARKPIRSLDQAVVVEGYMDVIALHQAGYRNAVSPMGTALTAQQLRMIKRFTRAIVLALDADAAGENATLRGLQVARETLDRESDPVFDARGLLRHEARLKADIRVTTLPAGMDPDDVVRENPDEWDTILKNAKPIVMHVMEALASTRDIEDPKVKDEIASKVLPLITDLPSSVERDTYKQRLARLLRVDERALVGGDRSTVRRRPRRTRRSPKRVDENVISKPISSQTNFYILETHILGLLVRRPDLLYKVDRSLQEEGLRRLSEDDFQHTDHKAILGLLLEAVNQDVAKPIDYIFNNLSLEMMGITDALLDCTQEFDLLEEKVLMDLVRAVLDIRHRNMRQIIGYVRNLMEDAREQGDIQATQHQKSVVKHTATLLRLDRAIGKYTDRSKLNS